MHRLHLLLFIAISLLPAGTDLSTVNGMYCRIDIEWSKEVTARVYTADEPVGRLLEDSSGQVLHFKSDVDVIQFMYENNWELVTADFISSSRYLAYFKKTKIP